MKKAAATVFAGPTDPEPRLLETAEGPVAVTEEGDPDAPAILCIHGLPGSTRDFRHLAPRLASALRVVRIDMPGFGRSPMGRVRTMRGWARIPKAVASALGLDRYLLAAHSFGGGAAFLAADRDPARVAGLVALASVGALRHRAYAWPPAVVRGLLAATRVPGLGGRMFEYSLRHYRRIGLPLPETMADLRLHLALMASLDFRGIGEAARRIGCPVLVAWAADDPVVEPAIARDLLDRLARGHGLEFPSGGHHIQKTQAAAIARGVLVSEDGYGCHVDEPQPNRRDEGLR